LTVIITSSGNIAHIKLIFSLGIQVLLRSIDKKQYRRRLKNTTLFTIIFLFAGSLSLSTLFIELMGKNGQSNFSLNIAGVSLTVLLLAVLILKLKKIPYFSDMYYVWSIKFELSHINRKIKAIEFAAKNGNGIALDILAYYYQATKQIWLLDDNTLTMDELVTKEKDFIIWMSQAEHSADVCLYKRQQLQQF